MWGRHQWHPARRTSLNVPSGMATPPPLSSPLELRVRESLRAAGTDADAGRGDCGRGGWGGLHSDALLDADFAAAWVYACSAIAAIADSACGYACLTKMPEDAAVLSVEFKINLLAPATGESFLAVGRVVRAGKTICVAAAEVFAEGAGKIQSALR